ncbi:unannotated protein [freshwater metagenome]|uniref:Unannotated protein n=1 Tax=freshwater metagenome TaxID=449393 RepID=A0A6J7F1Z1_9ZZZZ
MLLHCSARRALSSMAPAAWLHRARRQPAHHHDRDTGPHVPARLGAGAHSPTAITVPPQRSMLGALRRFDGWSAQPARQDRRASGVLAMPHRLEPAVRSRDARQPPRTNRGAPRGLLGAQQAPTTEARAAHARYECPRERGTPPGTAMPSRGGPERGARCEAGARRPTVRRGPAYDDPPSRLVVAAAARPRDPRREPGRDPPAGRLAPTGRLRRVRRDRSAR